MLFVQWNVTVVQCYTSEPKDDNGVYNWWGDYPNIANINPLNNTIFSNNTLNVTWTWWDDFTAGYGQVRKYEIILNNTYIIIKNDTTEDAEVVPNLMDINDVPKSFVINITDYGFVLGDYVSIFIAMEYHIDGHWKYPISVGYENVTINYKYDNQPEQTNYFSLDYIPYFIGGIALVSGVIFYQYYSEYRKTIKGLKKREEEIE